jgi:Cof subfamily protein (haloacid dehalogenase superfamily)
VGSLTGVLRLVATDLDGTLLHSDGTVTDRTRTAIGELERRGVAVVFVTGRPVRWMRQPFHLVGDHGLAICSNGAVVYDVPGRAVARAQPIDDATVLEVAEALRETVPGTTFAVERLGGFDHEPGYFVEGDVGYRPDLPAGPLEAVLDGQAVKMLARHRTIPPTDYWAQVDELVGGLVTTTWSSLGSLVEMSALGVTKASTLQVVCEERGIAPDEVVAFGDMPNDTAMLAWAGTSYAMAGAHESARLAAGRVAPGNDEDGVAAVLEDLFELA